MQRQVGDGRVFGELAGNPAKSSLRQRVGDPAEIEVYRWREVQSRYASMEVLDRRRVYVGLEALPFDWKKLAKQIEDSRRRRCGVQPHVSRPAWRNC